jgi:hypothetical protein
MAGLKKRARVRDEDRPETAPDAAVWRLEPHVCRHCFGRLVSCATAGFDTRLYQCSNCGQGATGRSPDVLCSCGTEIRRADPAGAPLLLGLRCQPNPAPSPDFPSLFVAADAAP